MFEPFELVECAGVAEAAVQIAIESLDENIVNERALAAAAGTGRCR